MRKRKHNPKREISPMPTRESLTALAKRIRYVGSPFHKRNPGDFGLVPPSQPRPDKTLCDGVQIFERQIAQDLLEEGVKAGLISVQQRGDFPQNIWTVSPSGIGLEAQLDNADRGTYHVIQWEMAILLRRECKNAGINAPNDERYIFHFG